MRAHPKESKMSPYCYLLLDGKKITSGVHPDSIISECYARLDGAKVYVVSGLEEEEKLLHLDQNLDVDMVA